MKEVALRRYSLATLMMTILVILWGAYVRAMGAGAGCGSHWPLCDGVVLPRTPATDTLIEFTHRVSSALAFLMVLGLFVWVWRKHSANHPARIYASWALFFMIIEALIGGVLVLFELVAFNPSAARAVVGAFHLLNTFLLLGCIVAVGEVVGEKDHRRFRIKRPEAILLFAGIFGIILVGMSGSVAALGDTLFPADSLLQGVSQDFSREAHFLIRLRVWHPPIAVITVVLLFAGLRLPGSKEGGSPHVRRNLVLLITLQLFAGAVNVVLLAPVWLQIVHLFLADLIWVTFILYLFRARRKPGVVLEGHSKIS